MQATVSCGLRGEITSRSPHGYVHLVACVGIDRVKPNKISGLNGGGGRRRAGVDGITKTVWTQQHGEAMQAHFIRSFWEQETGLLRDRRGRPKKPKGRAGPCAAERSHQRLRYLHARKDTVTFGTPRVGRGICHPQFPSQLRSSCECARPDGSKPRTHASPAQRWSACAACPPQDPLAGNAGIRHSTGCGCRRLRPEQLPKRTRVCNQRSRAG